MTDKAADWALPIIGNIIKGEGNPPTTIQALMAKFKEAFADPNAKQAAARKIAALTQTTTTSKYVTEFRNLMAELDWNEEAYIAQFTQGLHWKVKELLSTKDSVPDELEAIFAASIKIDNIRRKNEENRPKKAPAKSPVTATTSTSTTTTRVRLSEDPNYVTPEERDRRRASGLCVKCGQKGHGIKQCPNGWKATIKEVAKGLVTFPEQAQIASEEEANPDPVADLPSQYHEFAQVFGEEEFKVLPPHREYDIAIDLVPGAKLSPGPIYGMTDAESKALKQHIEEELATGKIRPSTSSAGAPVMFVKKADGSLRLVVDYRKLNDVTHKNVYPLPRQDDLMAKLRHAKMFTKLDLRWGYNNVRIKEGDEWKTAFRTKYGLFEYLVMPFGLTNAPAAFQHFMNDLFRDLIDVTVVIYLDNILIFSENPEDHPAHVREVLSQLMKNQLFCKLSKCHFHVTTVDYLGIVISPSGFSMDRKKVEAVTSWPQPRTVKQVQAFLGFVNYLRRFIPNFSSVARPLHNLTKKETPWSWGGPEEAAFQELKTLVTQSPVLIHSNPELPYYLETDASGVAMGAILSQRGPDNRLHPIAYMSKSFSGAEANYDTHDKELLAIIKALEEWRIFLEATDKPVQVFTDHHNLEYWMQARTFNRRHARWRVFLSDFNFEIHYRPGKQSGKPDALSRRPDYVDAPQEPEVMLPSEVFANTSEEELEIVTEVRSKLQEDPSLEPIIQFLTEDADNAPPSIRKAYRDYDWEEDLLWEVPKSSVSATWVKPAFSLAYHPESDGQTERVNQFIEFYLRSYVAANHSDWATWLPLAEYAYNNAKHSATGRTPFELVYGRNPVMNPSNVPANVPEADQVADTLAQEWKEAESALRLTKERMTRTTGTLPEYSIGERVWLDGKNIELRTNSNKLDPKRLGPFKVTKKVSSHAYRLELPETLKIHDVFYVGLLSKAHESPSQPFPSRPPPETIEGEEEYEVEQIIDSKRQQGKWFYLIKWKGYGPEDNSWEPEELLEHSQEEVKRFNQARLKKARDSAKSL
ncbi:hypothetical protein RHS01_00629 [Rhizoctonia solani]|uniref:Retrotransposable element Tf2 155 kDa protein type 1 n=1 Tax=Rhizoctonia solani TaxID=456999 RepID=A0A8H7M8L6_9AGAM|nr:hypothetical protein RHS01_00629 [Rhizoctonia solani]